MNDPTLIQDGPPEPPSKSGSGAASRASSPANAGNPSSGSTPASAVRTPGGSTNISQAGSQASGSQAGSSQSYPSNRTSSGDSGYASRSSSFDKSFLGRIDETCEKFEKALRTGESPKIEMMLQGLPEPDRRALFKELLFLKLEYRQRKEDMPNRGEYLQRFPEYEGVVQEIFEDPKLALGEYRIVMRLGKGGMGEVYKAIHTRLDRKVAVKVLPADRVNETRHLARFDREMKLVARLEHENIVRAFDAGEVKGRHFLVMEYVHGHDLNQLVDKHGQLPVGAACELIRQAALGLACAHENGIVHRDIKPSNIMVDFHSQRVKVLDLGLATLQGGTSELTDQGAVMGTVDYMAPEQWNSVKDVDIRADIYSLGCTLFHLLAGRPPYGDDSLNTRDKKMMAHLNSPVPSIRDLREDCPRPVAKILEKMLAKRMEDRYQTPAEVAAALAAYASQPELRDLMISDTSPSSVGDRTQTINFQGGSRPSRGSSINAPPPRPWIPVAAGAVLMAALSLLAFTFWPRGGEPVVVEPKTKDGEKAPPVDPLLARLGQVAATLPGVNGDSWFDEMPWFNPIVRAELLRAVAKGERRAELLPLLEQLEAEDLDAVYVAAEKLSRLMQADLKGAEGALARSVAALSPSSEQFNASVEQLAKGLPPAEGQSGPALHLQAAILQSASMATEAQQRYEQALEAYEQKDRELYTLCAIDLALLHDEKRAYLESISWLEKAREVSKELESPQLHVTVLAKLADVRAKNRSFTEANRTLDEARPLAEKLPPKHLLRAYLDQISGWVWLEQWRLQESLQAFQRAHDAYGGPSPAGAREVRRTEAQKVSAWRTRAWLWCRQGEAMAAHFLGDQETAREGLEGSLLAISQAEEGAVADSRAAKELARRKPNLLERLGDCSLYGTPSDLTIAREQLVKAIFAAELSEFDRDFSRAAELLRLRYQLALVEFLSKTPTAEGSLAHAQNKEAAAELEANQLRGVELTKTVTLALRDLRDATPDNDAAAYQKLAETLRTQKVARRNVEMLLLVSELLCESGQLDTDGLGEVGRWLIKLGTELRGEAQPYLRRYLLAAEMAIKKSQEAAPDASLMLVLEELQKALGPGGA